MLRAATLPGGFKVETTELKESTKESLESDFEENGFAFLRGLIDEKDVADARAVCVQALVDQGDVVNGDLERIVAARDPMIGLLERQDVGFECRLVLESAALSATASILLGSKTCRVFPYKWLRAVAQSLFTGFHIDKTYLSTIPSLASSNVISAWIPLGRIAPENGALVITTNRDFSQRAAKLSLNATDGTHSGWLDLNEEDAQSILWQTTIFRPGDAILFGPGVLHCTAVNTSSCVRLSCDVRFSTEAAK